MAATTSQGTPKTSQETSVTNHETQAPREICSISRVLHATPELVYRAFVDADQFARWFAPEGASVLRETVESDPRVGGHLRWEERASELPDLRVRVEITFTEVLENELLVGDMAVNRMGNPDWPDGVIRSTLRLEFHPEHGDRTRLEIRHGPFTETEARGHRGGWQETLGKLSKLLASQDGQRSQDGEHS